MKVKQAFAKEVTTLAPTASRLPRLWKGAGAASLASATKPQPIARDAVFSIIVNHLFTSSQIASNFIKLQHWISFTYLDIQGPEYLSSSGGYILELNRIY
jgi:hypothetical protein